MRIFEEKGAQEGFGFEFQVLGFSFWVSGFGSWVSGFEFRMCACDDAEPPVHVDCHAPVSVFRVRV